MNRDPTYAFKLVDLSKMCNEDDFELILDLLDQPLTEQQRVYSSTLPYLEDEHLDAVLKIIKPVRHWFYSFSFPDDMASAYIEQKTTTESNMRTHSHRRRDWYIITKEEIRHIEQTCADVLERKEISNMNQWYELAVAIQMVTGRRMIEVLSTLVVSPVASPYQAEVSGIAKKVYRDDKFTIPILCHYSVLSRELNRLRSYRDVSGFSVIELNNKCGVGMRRATTKLFARPLTHTQKRNVYAEIAWSRRFTENQYMIGERSCSKSSWVSAALCHETPSSLAVTERYQLMDVHM